MDSEEPFVWLTSLQSFGIKLGLAQVEELLAAVGHPERRLRFVHLAGTNGKGSVGALLAAGCTHAGLRTGFYTSPHLISVTERFRIDGKAIPEAKLAELIQRLRPAAERMAEAGRCPTYFEVTTVLAALHFADRGVDLVIWETGMGGRFDATNVITPLVSVITGIGLDHLAHLGATEAAIAGEKAGIIKAGVPVFRGPMSREACAVIDAAARAQQAPLTPVEEACVLRSGDSGGRRQVSWQGTEFILTLPGTMQLRNAALAAAVVGYLATTLGFSREVALAGFARARWPARRQRLADGTLIDGAHNPPAVVDLAAELAQEFPGERFTLVFGCLADKDAGTMLSALVPLVAAAWFVPVPGSGRAAADPATLAAVWARLGGVPATVADLETALAAPTPFRRLVAGSLYLAGAALARYGMADQVLDLA